MKKHFVLLVLFFASVGAYLTVENHFALKYYELYQESGSHFSFHEAILKDRIERLNSEIRLLKVEGGKDDAKLIELEGEREEIVSALTGVAPLKQELRLTFLTQEDFHYFAWVSGTSTGYGDIFPLSTKARNAVKQQVILSLTLLSFISSLLIALVLSLKEKILESV